MLFLLHQERRRNLTKIKKENNLIAVGIVIKLYYKFDIKFNYL